MQRVPTQDAAWSTDDFEEAVLESIDSTPAFVNRNRESYEIFCMNARNITQIRKNKEIDPQNLTVVVAAQHYGAGKTCLGRNFVRQFGKEIVSMKRRIALMKRTIASTDDHQTGIRQMLEEADILFQCDSEDHYCLIDVRNQIERRDIFTLINEELTKEVKNECSFVEVVAAILEKAQRNNPKLLVCHFDEVTPHQIPALSSIIFGVWRGMFRLRGTDHFPRVYFFLTGKGYLPVAATDVQQSSSPFTTHYLVLDALSKEHIKEVVESLDSPLKLEAEVEGKVLDLLELYTAGAPRLLLFYWGALTFLHCLGETLTSDNADSIFEKVTVKLGKVGKATDEARFSGDSYYSFCMLLAMFQIPIPRNKRVHINGRSKPIFSLLSRVPCFLQRVNDMEFKLVFSLFHNRVVMKEREGKPIFVSALFDRICRFPRSGSMRWNMWEVTPTIFFASTAACLSGPRTWSDALPQLFGTSDLMGQITFDLGPEPYRTHNLPRVDNDDSAMKEKLIDFANKGAVFPSDKSPSPDLFYVHSTDKTFDCVQIQTKLLTKTAMSFSMLRKEFKKVVPGFHRTAFVLLCTAFNETMERLFESKNSVLILKPAMYVWEKKGPKQELFWLLDGHWYNYPDKAIPVGAPRIKDKSTNCLEVPSDFEVIIPSPGALRDYFGDVLTVLLSEEGDPSSSLSDTMIDDLAARLQRPNTPRLVSFMGGEEEIKAPPTRAEASSSSSSASSLSWRELAELHKQINAADSEFVKQRLGEFASRLEAQLLSTQESSVAQAEGEWTVGKWLKSIGLGMYESIFVENGFENPADVAHLSEETLSALNITKVFHRQRLLVSAEEFKRQLESSQEESASRVEPSVAELFEKFEFQEQRLDNLAKRLEAQLLSTQASSSSSSLN